MNTCLTGEVPVRRWERFRAGRFLSGFFDFGFFFVGFRICGRRCRCRRFRSGAAAAVEVFSSSSGALSTGAGGGDSKRTDVTPALCAKGLVAAPTTTPKASSPSTATAAARGVGMYRAIRASSSAGSPSTSPGPGPGDSPLTAAISRLLLSCMAPIRASTGAGRSRAAPRSSCSSAGRPRTPSRTPAQAVARSASRPSWIKSVTGDTQSRGARRAKCEDFDSTPGTAGARMFTTRQHLAAMPGRQLTCSVAFAPKPTMEPTNASAPHVEPGNGRASYEAPTSRLPVTSLETASQPPAPSTAVAASQPVSAAPPRPGPRRPRAGGASDA